MTGTSSAPRGRTTALRMSDQADFQTQAPDTFVELNVYAPIVFNKKRPLDDDDVLGHAGYANVTDARPAAPGTEDADGSLAAPLDLAQIGYWLKGALGQPGAPTGGGPYVHTFSSGADIIPVRTLERKMATNQYEALIGAVVQDITFAIGADKGYGQCPITLGGRQVTDPLTASIAGAPTVIPLAARVPKSVGLVAAGGVQIGLVQSGTLKIANTFVMDRYANDVFNSAVYLEKQEATYNITARYKTDSLRNLGKTGADGYLPDIQSIAVTYSLGAGLSLVITTPAVRFEPVSVSTQNGGMMTQQLVGRAEVGTDAPMLTAVLTNARSTVY